MPLGPAGADEVEEEGGVELLLDGGGGAAVELDTGGGGADPGRHCLKDGNGQKDR